eukprot:TRINITY_DN28809_c0_g1_i2.p1 TRINITY_DN28809_c0_g1~~TRINITY_DN28809_c0_g1_i2.p1  ORF type:complete len:122 (-),score=28.09 TRINITY_DN28809_c0_g1_i2:20-385(-)
MHKRMQGLSARLGEIANPPQALVDDLYRAQANDAYWHGLFGVEIKKEKGNNLTSRIKIKKKQKSNCLLYTSDAADDMQCVVLGRRRSIKKKKKQNQKRQKKQTQQKQRETLQRSRDKKQTN